MSDHYQYPVMISYFAAATYYLPDNGVSGKPEERGAFRADRRVIREKAAKLLNFCFVLDKDWNLLGRHTKTYIISGNGYDFESDIEKWNPKRGTFEVSKKGQTKRGAPYFI